MEVPPRRAITETSTFLVERYWPGVTEPAFAEAARRVSECVDALRAAGAPIRTRSSTLVPSDEAAYWVFEATTKATVERVYACAGVPFERIAEAFEATVADDVLAER